MPCDKIWICKTIDLPLLLKGIIDDDIFSEVYLPVENLQFNRADKHVNKTVQVFLKKKIFCC